MQPPIGKQIWSVHWIKTVPAALFVPLVTEKLDALRQLPDIFKGQITEKTKLKTTETQTKIVEQNKNSTYPPPRVEPK